MTFFQSCFVCSLNRVPKEAATHTAAFADIISFFFLQKISGSHQSKAFLPFSPLSCFFHKERRKKIHTHPCRKEGKKRLTRRLKRHLLSHIYSFTHQNVSSAQLIQSVNQCLGGASLFPFIIYFFLPFFFFLPGKSVLNSSDVRIDVRKVEREDRKFHRAR